MTVLRNGRHIATGPVAAFGDDEVIAHDRRPGAVPRLSAAPSERGRFGPEVLGAERISTAGKLRDASFSLRAGEILGVAGLQGMGQLDLFLACFGMTDLTGGTLASRWRADRHHLAGGRRARQYRHQPGAGRPQDRSAVAQAQRQAQCLAAGDRSLRPRRPDRRRARERRSRGDLRPGRCRPRALCGRGSARSPAAISRRSPSPNGFSPKAASCFCSIRPAASTSAPRTSSIASFAPTPTRAARSFPLDRDSRARAPLPTGCSFSTPAGSRRTSRPIDCRKRRSCAPRWRRRRRREGGVTMRGRGDAVPGGRRALPAAGGGASARLLIAIAVFLALLATVALFSSARSAITTCRRWRRAARRSSLAAMGQTIVILSGGFDLSAGAVISLVNVRWPPLQDPSTSPFLILAAGVASARCPAPSTASSSRS